MSLDQIANHLDFFAEPVNFTYRNKTNFKTVCGGITTLIIISILFGFFSVLLRDMLLKTIPIVNQINYLSDEPEIIQIISALNISDTLLATELNNSIAYWPISFGISLNSVVITLNETFLKLSAFQYSVTSGEIISTPLSTNLCQNFGFLNNSNFLGLSLNSTYCLENNFYIGGIQGSEGSSWLSVQISSCIGSNCAHKSDILNYVKSLQFEFYYEIGQLYLDSTGDQVIRYSVGQTYFDNIPTIAKIFSCELGFDELKSYDNYLPDFLMPVYNTFKALVVRSLNTELIDLGDDNIFLQLNFIPSRLRVLYIRRFKDFITQISKLGGLISVFSILGYLFSFVYVNFDMTETMMNDFYNIIDPKNNSIFKKSFESFVREHYHNLIILYCIKKNIVVYETNNFEKQNNVNLLQKNATSKIFTDTITKRKSYDGIVNLPKRNNIILQNESKIEFEEIEDIDENIMDDDEGLFEFELEIEGVKNNNKANLKEKYSNNQNINLLKRFFTLKRIESMYNVNVLERDEIIEELKMSNLIKNSKLDFYENIFMGKKRTKFYYANKMFYDSLKYMGCNKMNFSIKEMLKIIYCPCRMKKTNKNYDAILKEKHDIYQASLQKLGIDFDLVSVLKSVRDLKKFKNIYFDKNQKKIFSSINKNTIIITKEEFDSMDKNSKEILDTKSENKTILKSMKDYYKMILNILKRGSVSPLERKMFKIIGMSSENIKYLCSAAEAKFEKKKENIKDNKKEEIEITSNENSFHEKNSEINSLNKMEIENEIIDKIINKNI